MAMKDTSILMYRVLQWFYYHRAILYLNSKKPHIGLLRMKWVNDYLDGVPTCEVPLKF